MSTSFSKLLKVSVPAPKRSNFDLSHPVQMTIAPGLLYPVLVEEILPGDDIDCSIEARLKTHPTIAPILGAFDCTYYKFFCPLRNYVPEMNLNVKQTEFRDEFTLPYMRIPSDRQGTLTDSTQIFRVPAGSLLEYLGFPVGMSFFAGSASTGDILAGQETPYNGVPLLCYLDIWRNYFANPQAEEVDVYMGWSYAHALVGLHPKKTLNVSAFDNVFTGLLQGAVNVGNLLDQQLEEYYTDMFNLSTYAEDTVENNNAMNVLSSHAGLLPVTYHDDMFTARLNTSYVNYVQSQVRVSTTQGYFTIDSLRLSNKLAKFVDKTILGGTRYGQWLKSHFAVNGMEHLNIPIFLGMDKMSLYFDDVVSQAQTGESDNGDLGSTGGRGSVHYPDTPNDSFYAKEHGYYVVLMALRPRVSYFQGIPKYLQKTQFSDIYVPELDAVGWQPILAKDLYANTLYMTNTGNALDNANRIVGYSPAWIEYMTRNGRVHGQFTSSLDYWVLLRRFGALGTYNSNAEEWPVDIDYSTYVDPEDYNYAFVGQADWFDNFYLNQWLSLYIKRNISKQILPTL